MTKPFQVFVTGISTEVGKTVVSAILAATWDAHYFKPVQAGDLDNTDASKVLRWAGLQPEQVMPERYRLKHPMSPHAAAEREGLTIHLDDFHFPETDGPLIVEGAGGLMVPLNRHDLMIDLIERFSLPVVLVSRNYLGSINHTLLSIEQLKVRKIPLMGIIFTGEPNPETESVVETIGKVRVLGRVPEWEAVNQERVCSLAQSWKDLSWPNM